jgi:hypothetical protein
VALGYNSEPPYVWGGSAVFLYLLRLPQPRIQTPSVRYGVEEGTAKQVANEKF